DVREIVVAVFRWLEYQQNRALLATEQLADHAFGRRFKQRRAQAQAADARSGARHHQPMAAVDAFALFARHFVGHLEGRFTSGAFKLHRERTPKLERERCREDENRGGYAERRSFRRVQALIFSLHTAKARGNGYAGTPGYCSIMQPTGRWSEYPVLWKSL